MPIIKSKDQSTKSLKGLHLWHDDMSSCSQRVRAVLTVKGVAWEDHLLAILHGDTTTPEFLALNPKGLVPVLVHDGDLWVESMDIIDHLDRTFPEPGLRPTDPDQARDMERWMQIADGAQYDLKVLSHEFLFRAARNLSDLELETFENNVDNPVLVDFLRVYTQGDILPENMVTDSVNKTDAWFRQLDDALAGRNWLVGDDLSLADIAWMPNAHRYELMDWPLERYANVQAWHGRVKKLQAYHEGIVKWEPPPAREMLTGFVQSRGADGYHVRNFGVLAT